MASTPPTEYRVVDLGRLAFVPDTDLDLINGTFGINNHGQVAFGRLPLGMGSVVTAHIWLPEASSALGLPQGFHEISGATAPSIARDINNAGIVVGQYGNIAESGGTAFTYDAGTGVLTTFSPPGSTWSAGHGITEGTEPWISGHALTTIPCTDQPLPETTVIHGFYARLTSPLPTPVYVTPDLSGDDDDSRAFDLIPDVFSGSLPVRVVGDTDDTVVRPSGFCLVAQTPDCRPDEDPVFWSASATVPDELPGNVLPSKPSLIGSHARAINTAGDVVGWAALNEQQPCPPVAAFWEANSSGAYATARIDLDDPPSVAADSHALGLNDLDPPTIVGFNPLSNFALRWTNSGSAWSAVDLQGLIPACANANLTQAMDINDHGWIIAWGLDTADDDREHAFLLIPIPACPSDVDRDGDVDTEDLLDLLAAWGTCPAEGVVCWADLNNDCTVNVLDQLQLLADWGNNCDGTGSIPEDVQDCLDKFGSDIIALQSCIDAVLNN